MPCFILIHPTVWPKYTKVRDRHDKQTDRQQSDSRANRYTDGCQKIKVANISFTHIKHSKLRWQQCVVRSDLLSKWSGRKLVYQQVQKKHHRVETRVKLVKINQQTHDFLL